MLRVRFQGIAESLPREVHTVDLKLVSLNGCEGCAVVCSGVLVCGVLRCSQVSGLRAAVEIRNPKNGVQRVRKAF